MNRIWWKASVSVVALVALGGCGSATTPPDQAGIRYEGSVFLPQDPSFKGCQGPGTQEFGDPGDNVYPYPVGQRTFKFSNDPGSDAPPMVVSAPSPGGGQPIDLTVSGTVTFTPNFGNCDTLRRFHEEIGIKYRAWEPAGWAQVLGVYVKDPTERAADNEALKFNWVQLTSDANAKAQWEQSVVDTIPQLIQQQAGGEYFTINSVLLQRPELPDNVRAAIAETEAARQQAATAEQVRIAAESFPGGIVAYQTYLQQQAVNQAIRDGKVQVLPIPQGSPVIVQPGAGG